MKTSSTIMAGLGLTLLIIGTSIAEPMSGFVFGMQISILLAGAIIMALAVVLD